MTLYTKEKNRYKPVITIHNFDVEDRYIDENGLRGSYLSDKMQLPPGLWLSRQVPNCKSLTCLSRLEEIPTNPYDFTAIKVNVDELAVFIGKFRANYVSHSISWEPSNQELATAVLDFLVKKAGVTMTDKIAIPSYSERRLDLEL